MKDQFVVHGKTSISLDGDIIIIESTGPWNAEYFYGLQHELQKIVEQINRENYAVLLIPIGETLGTPEAIESHFDFIRKGNTKAVAINLSRSETPSMTKSLCCDAYIAAGITFDFFSSNEQAKDWLNSKLT